MNLVAFLKQKIGKVGAILASDAGDLRAFHVIFTKFIVMYKPSAQLPTKLERLLI
jgi:hypothetical protein